MVTARLGTDEVDDDIVKGSWLIADLHGVSHRLSPKVEVRIVVRVQLEERLALSDVIAFAHETEPPRRRADRILLAGASRGEPPCRNAHGEGIDSSHEALTVRSDHLDEAGRRHGSVRVAALRCDH